MPVQHAKIHQIRVGCTTYISVDGFMIAICESPTELPCTHSNLTNIPPSSNYSSQGFQDFKRQISRQVYWVPFEKNRTHMSVDCFNGRRWTPDCQYFVTVKRHEYKNRIYKHGFRSRHFWHLTNSLLPEWLLYMNIHPKRIYCKSIKVKNGWYHDKNR